MLQTKAINECQEPIQTHCYMLQPKMKTNAVNQCYNQAMLHTNVAMLHPTTNPINQCNYLMLSTDATY